MLMSSMCKPTNLYPEITIDFLFIPSDFSCFSVCTYFANVVTGAIDSLS